jgi:signal transduction histidine kinase
MKIRNKITLTFAALVSFVLLLSFSLIYYFSVHYIEKGFYDLVLEKANLTAWKYYEKDEMSSALYGKVIESYSKSLPEAEEIVLDTKNKIWVIDSLRKIVPKDDINKLLSGNTIKFKAGDRQSVGIYYPDNQGRFIVIVTAVNKYGIQQQKQLLEMLLMIFLGSIVFMFLIGRLYATNVLYPIVNLLKNVKRIRATNLNLRLKEKAGNDELAELTRTFNQMLDRLENSFSLQKDFIHNASHELKNPLTAILGETEIALGKQRSPDEYITTLSKIMAEAERLDMLTRNLLSLAQIDFDLSTLKKEEIRLDELIWEIKEHFDKTKYKGRIEIHFPILPETSDLITIMGIPTLLRIAIENLIDNACKFSGQQKVDVTLNTSQKNIQIQITDKGIGIPELEKNNLFQPFFRASNAITYKGSGIGLSLVHKIITMYGGMISISSIMGKGTTVIINF